jgi:hypothetical protein
VNSLAQQAACRFSLRGVSLRRRRWCGLWLLLALLAPARASRAQSRSAHDLEYLADLGCPDRGVFEAWVDAELHEARETTAGARARAAVRLLQGPDGATARLELTREDGSRYARELGGESCEAAAQGLAFVLAYALGGGDPLDAPVPEIQPKPVEPVAPPPPLPLSPAAAVAPPRAAPAPAPVASSARWHFGLGAQLGARTGLGPIWTPVEVGLLDVRRRKTGFAPVLRLAVLRAEPIQRVDAFGTTEFSWLAARIEGCPLQLPLIEPLRVAPCVGAHLGRIRAEGRPARTAGGSGQVADEIWADAVVALRLELTLAGVLQLEAQGDVVVPFTPYLFAFDNPDTSVYQVPGVAAAGYVGLGLHFP